MLFVDERLQLPLDRSDDGVAERLGRRDQRSRRVRTVLGLAEQIGGHDGRIGRLVGDHRDLRRAGEEIDRHLAEQLPLGFGDEGVPGTDEHVDRALAEQPERHRGERLDAAEHVDAVRTGQVSAVEHRRVGRAVGLRRGAGEHGRHAGRLGDADRHERAGEDRESARRQVRADAGDRDVAVAGADAGGELGLEIARAGCGSRWRTSASARRRARAPGAGPDRADRRCARSSLASSSTSLESQRSSSLA